MAGRLPAGRRPAIGHFVIRHRAPRAAVPPEPVLAAQQQFRQLKAADAQVVESAVKGHRGRYGMRVNLGDEAAHQCQDGGGALFVAIVRKLYVSPRPVREGVPRISRPDRGRRH